MRLYYENAYLKDFYAVVTECVKTAKGYGITLDRTAFYPEGGGQPFDTGFIGDTAVHEVREREGKIIHYTSEPIAAGKELECKIDWERRFQLMQGHTGEHILSGIINEHFGLANVGFHMGSEFITIDIDGILKNEELELAENLANQGVYENIPVETGFKSGQELDAIDYRSKLELTENVRIVHIEGYDTCACCGVHCRATGDIGAIKIVNCQNYKAGMRIYLLCGKRAMEDYGIKNKSAYEISTMLSAKPYEISEAVKQLLEENAGLGRSLSLLKSRLLTFIADSTPGNSEHVCVFENGLTSDELRRLCLLICERTELAAVFSGVPAGYKYAIGSKKHDIRQLASMLNTAFNGKGGGKKELVQGSITGDEEHIRAFIQKEVKQFF